MAYDVSATDFSRTASMPAASISAIMSCIASIPTTAACRRRSAGCPAAGAYDGPIRNGSTEPSQPWIGWVSDDRCREAT